MENPSESKAPHPAVAAAIFAIGQEGPVADEITPRHIMAAGAYLATQGLATSDMLAYLGKAYELMQREQRGVS